MAGAAPPPPSHLLSMLCSCRNKWGYLNVDPSGGEAPPAVPCRGRPAVGACARPLVRRPPVQQRGVRLDVQPPQAHLQAECGRPPIPAAPSQGGIHLSLPSARGAPQCVAAPGAPPGRMRAPAGRCNMQGGL